MANNVESISLRDKLAHGSMSPMEVMDATLLLGRWLSDEEYSGHRERFEPLSPDSIVFNTQNMPSVLRRGTQTSTIDLAYYSPQLAIGKVEACEEEDWFSLGLIFYHMMTGKLLYETLPGGIFAPAGSIAQMIRKGRFPGYEQQITMAICKLCGTDVDSRVEGFGELIEYSVKHFPGIVEIEGTCQGKAIRLPDIQFGVNSELDYRLPAQYTIDGIVYATDTPVVSYRPGKHLYHVILRQVGSVQSGGGSGYKGRWLITNAQNNQWARLICLDDCQGSQYDIPIELTPVGWTVVLTETTSGQNKILQKWMVGKGLDSAVGRRCILRFSRPAGSDVVTVSLLNLEKTQLLSNNLNINMRQF